MLLLVSGCNSKEVPKEEVEKQDVILTTNDNSYSLEVEKIEFVLENNSNDVLYTHVSPTLVIKTDTGWKELKMNDTAAFCGNLDLIREDFKLEFHLSWYDELKPGEYRVSYGIYSGNELEEASYKVSKEFRLE